MKKTKLFSLMLAGVMLLTACGSGDVASSGSQGEAQGSEEKAYKDTLVVALASEPQNLDPTISTNAVNRQAEVNIFNTLVDLTPEGEIVPELATKWEQIDNYTIRFYLRDDVYFHNGEKLTAEDVKFSLHRLTAMGVNTSMYTAFDTENTEVVDELTIDVKMKEPFAAAYNFLAAPYAGIHCKKYVEEVGDDHVVRNPVGTGPFKLIEWRAGDALELERFDDYWGEKPTYSHLTMRFISEGTTRTIELETGGVDVIYNVPIADLERLKENDELNVIIGPGRRYTYCTINMKDPTFADERVREAILCALDMETIVENVYGDMATVADSIINPRIIGYHSMGVVEYNPERAKELLKEAGAENLSFTLKMNDDSTFIACAEIMANMWKQVGITCDVQVLEMATYTDQGARGEVQIGISSYSTASGDADQALQTWKTTYNGQIQGNDPKIDELLLKARQEWDYDQRMADYAEAIEYMWNTHYMIPIAFNNLAFATGDNVEGLECHPGEVPDLAKVVIYEK